MKENCLIHIKNFVHPYLLPLKAVFFFQLGAASCLIPYTPLFIQHLGLNAAENGLIFGALPFVAMVSKPSAGALADKWKSPLTLLRVFSVIQLIFMFSIFFVPKIDQPTSLASVSNISCSGEYFFAQVGVTAPWREAAAIGNFSCKITTSSGDEDLVTFTNDSVFADFSQKNHSVCDCSWNEFAVLADDTLVRWTVQFWLTGAILAVGWFGYGAAVTVNDAIAFSLVQNSPVPTTYGANRVLGTIGWAVFALLVGLLLDTFSETSAVVDRDFTPAFITFPIVACCGILCTFFFKKEKTVTESSTVAASVGRSLLTFDVLLFCGGTFVAGICSGMLYGYLAWYQSELGGSNLLIGLTVFVQCCYEAPMMAISAWIIRKLGYHGCMLMCLLSFGIRFLGYYWMVDPWLVLLIDVVHSVGYGLFYASMTSFAFEKAPPGGTATLQGILGATYEGFGQGIGGIAAGFLYQKYGGKTTWLGYGIFSLVAATAYAIGGIISRTLAGQSKIFK